MNAEQMREALAADFRTKRSTLESVEVPEIGDGFKLYFYRKMDVRTLELLAPHIMPPNLNIITASFVAFVMAARDQDGKRLYTAQDLDAMRSGKSPIDPELVVTIVDRMGLLKGDDLSIEDEVKKSLSGEISAEK